MLPVSGMIGSGTVTARLAAGVAHNAAGNPNVASTSTDNTVTYRIPPAIAGVVVAEAGHEELHPRIERPAENHLGRVEPIRHRLADPDR